MHRARPLPPAEPPEIERIRDLFAEPLAAD